MLYKAFVLINTESGDITDMIVTNDVVGPRDQATLQEFLADSPEMHLQVVQVNGDSLPSGTKWWPSLADYFAQWDIALEA